MKAPITDQQLLEMMWERFPEIMGRGVEQPAQQEPVAIVAVDGVGQIQIGWIKKPQHNDKLYTSPPAQRTWVGLTDEEITAVFGSFPKYPSEWDDSDFYQLTQTIEAKLKEKNNG